MGDADDSQDSEMGRRQLINHILLTAAAAFGGSQAGNMNIVSYLTNLAEAADDAVTTPLERNKTFHSVFGNHIEEFSIDEGIVHHKFDRPRHHEDNLRTSIGLSRLLAEDITPLPVAEAKAENNPELLERDIISIGSIESNFAARLQYNSLQQSYGSLDSVLRWRIRPSDSVETKRYVVPPEALQSDTLAQTQNFNRFDGKREVWTSGNSGMRDYHRELRKTPHIHTGGRDDGFIDKDLLLVSKLPNIITQRAADSGTQFVHFAGTHGIGTRGTLQMLRNQKVWESLRSQTQSTQYFQAVFVVHASHNHGETDSIPKKIEPADHWFNDWFYEVEI